MEIPEHSLELLLDYNGRKYFLYTGHYLKFEVRQVAKSEPVPHGIAYCLTLHDPDGKRLIGFDNAHPIRSKGKRYFFPPVESDHWHRTFDDPGRPYKFLSTENLLQDFFTEVERTLNDLGVSFDIK